MQRQANPQTGDIMVSIVIAAHNEETVLGATLDALVPGSAGTEVVVVPNGCTDGTAAVARSRPGVVVVELEAGGKPLAMNVGDAAVTSFPRIYLDADIQIPPGGVDALVAALDQPGVMASVPARRLDISGRPWPVRAYFAINERLPVFRDGLFGRGVIVLSAAGRARFGEFPLMVADDLFLDSLFAADEKAQVAEVVVTVETPFTTTDLVRRLVRVRRGNAAMRAAAHAGEIEAAVRQADRWSWLRDVVARDPRLVFAGLVYVVITLVAALRARQGPLGAMTWGRDDSTRRSPAPPPSSTPSGHPDVPEPTGRNEA